MKALRRTLAGLLVGPLLALGLPIPAQAGIVGTDPAHLDRARIERLAERALIERGVDPGQARARAAALTDEEVARIAAEIDKLPAGADGGVFLATVVMYAVVAVAALAVLIVALPFLLMAKVAKERDEKGAAREGNADTDDSGVRYPAPQY